MKHYTTHDVAELSQVISKIFNISQVEVHEHFPLFAKIDPVMKNCLYYLAQIEDDNLKTSTALSLEFITKFKQSPFH